MTSGHTNEVIEIIFLAMYVPLLALNLVNFVKHGNGKHFAYGSLVIFDLVRILGNALLIAAYQMEMKGTGSIATITHLYTGGYVMQSIGYSALFIASLYLYARGAGGDKKANQDLLGLVKFQGLHVLNIVATILLIVGITDSDGLFSGSSTATVKPLTKAGSYLYCATTAVLGAMIVYHIFIKGPISHSARITLTFCLVAMVPMCVRVGYAAYRVQANKFVNYNPWAHLVCQDIIEIAVVVIYIVLGFYLAHKGGDDDLGENVQISSLESSAVENTLYRDVDSK